MRIALVSEVFLPAVDGVVTRLRRTLEELPRAGDEVLMIAPAGGPESYAGVPVLGVRGLRVPLYPDGEGYPPKRVALPGPALSRALRAYRPDVVHAIQPVLLGVGAVAYARRNRVPLVASYHAHLPSYAKLYRLGWLESGGWRYLRGLHNCAQVNLATSCATLAELQAQRVERLALWPYGVDLERFHPGHASAGWRERLSQGHPERLVLLYVGRLAKEKTVERLVEAVRGRPDVALAIVGDGPLRSQLERRFRATNTTFLGFLGGPDLARAYASADLFVLPSQTETLGMVTLEAHAAGLPVIAADSPAARELVRHGIDGLRYDPAVPGALAGAVSLLSADPALGARMGKNALAAVSGATWRHATQILRQHYVQACERVRPRPAVEPAQPAAGLAAVVAEPVDPPREAV
ncbi:MAG TPA: glycosyltransferase family 1 protein [Solirubrobacteraceae bacterium]|nr:glycosyltransferase family 1 protein [Solirubrobacteraceae bacterium]